MAKSRRSVKKVVVVFYANTESGDRFLCLLPRKLNANELTSWCKSNFPDDFEAGTLNGRQLELSDEDGGGIQL